MKFMKKTAICLLLISTTINAETSPVGDSMFYYNIGGGRVFKAVPRWDVTTLSFGIKASLTGLSCGSFDPKVTVSNTLNNVKDGLEDMYSQVEAAASAAISNLPGYILSKVNPNLYDLFMNSIAQANAKFSLATKSCELIESEIRSGTDPFETFAKISVGDKWKVGVGISGVDIQDVKDDVNSTNNDIGVTHPCHGRAGGTDQESYNLIKDTAEVGFNRLIGRSPCLATIVPMSNTLPPLAIKFRKPSDVSDWTARVIGDVIIDNSDEDFTASKSKAGTGILPLINEKKELVYNALVDLYDGSEDLTLDNLSEVSAPGVLITGQVITALRTISPQEAQIFIDRISDEIAISDLIDSALLVRRALSTGMKETEFYSLDVLRDEVTIGIAEIDSEIDLVMKEDEIKKKLMGSSIPVLLNMMRSLESISKTKADVLNRNSTIIEDGRVKP